MLEVSFALGVPANCPLAVGNRYADIRLLGLKSSRSSVEHLLEISADERQKQALKKELAKYAVGGEVDIAHIGNGKHFAIMACSPCAIYEAVSRYHGFIMAETLAPGCLQVKAIFKDDKSMKNAFEFLETKKIATTVLRLTRVGRRVALTARQHEIIKTAFKTGYMDCPRRIGIRDLSDLLKVSKSTVSESLRRAEKKLVEQYLEDG